MPAAKKNGRANSARPSFVDFGKAYSELMKAMSWFFWVVLSPKT